MNLDGAIGSFSSSFTGVLPMDLILLGMPKWAKGADRHLWILRHPTCHGARAQGSWHVSRSSVWDRWGYPRCQSHSRKSKVINGGLFPDGKEGGVRLPRRSIEFPRLDHWTSNSSRFYSCRWQVALISGHLGDWLVWMPSFGSPLVEFSGFGGLHINVYYQMNRWKSNFILSNIITNQWTKTYAHDVYICFVKEIDCTEAI